jgi:pyruvate-ferredoxin/flavodoxin oxidoreductase
LKEANEHNGPSLIIAYSPCIEHGIRKGMEYSLENGSLATKCGYFLTFRYKPDEEKLYLDSKNVDFSLYDEFLSNENRYVNLKRVNPENAHKILSEQKEYPMKRFNYYKRLSEFSLFEVDN